MDDGFSTALIRRRGTISSARGEQIGPAYLLELTGLPLIGLSLRDCQLIRGTGLSALAGSPLQHLDLSGTSLIHTSLAALSELPLHHLDLSRTPLIPLDALRQALEARGDDMVARMVIGEVWQERYTFRWDEGYGEFWVEDLEPPEMDDPDQPIPALSEEDLVAVELDDHERWSSLRGAAELYDLDLSELQVELSGFSWLPRGLRVLELAETPFGDREAQVLRELRELRVLGLAGTAIQDLSVLAELRQLKALDLSGTTFQDLLALVDLPELRGLRLGHLRLDGLQSSALASMAVLESLAIHDSVLLEATLLGVAVLPTLRQLSLYRCELENAALFALGGSVLEELDLSRCRLGVDRLGLGDLHNLRLLRLSNTDLELPDLDRLRALQSLEVLSLGFVDLPREALEALASDLPEVTVELAFREDAEA
mgnify:CR=1 FL=1